jgi:hypothetical protein
MAKTVNYTNFSFDEIKESLKEVLRNDGVITDFEYEGSNTDTLLNVLAYVGTLVNHNINYMSNEAFLSTAASRKNVIKHAQALNYKVDRKHSAVFEGNLKFTLAPKRKLKIPAYSAFTASDGTQFITTKTLEYSNTTTFSQDYYENCILQEGKYVSHKIDSELTFSYDQYQHNTIVLKYKDIEHGSIKMDVSSRTFTETENLMNDILLKKNVFITEYDPDTEYVRIKMLNKYNISPNDGENARINFIISSGTKGNNYAKLSAKTFRDASLDPSITNTNEISVTFEPDVGTVSYGGTDEESTDEIKMYAPLAKATANRYITSLDWTAGLVSLPQVKNASVWGGDEIGNDLALTSFTSAQKDALKQSGTVFMSGLPSSTEKYFNIQTIEKIKNLMRENSVVSLRKKFIQPIYVGVDLNINAVKDPNKQSVLTDVINLEIISRTNNFFNSDFNIQLKKSKLLNNLYSIDGLDSVDIDGTKLSMDITGMNFYDDSTDYLDVSLPIRGTNSPLSLTKITSVNEYQYTFDLKNIPDGITTTNSYVYDPTVDSFLDHVGIQMLNYFTWSNTHEYLIGQKIVYNGYIYEATKLSEVGQSPSGTATDNAYWTYIPKTSNYMDRWGYPVKFDNYKRIVLEHNDGTEFVIKTSETTDFYDAGEVVWKYDTSTSKIEYYMSLVGNNKQQDLTNTEYWKKLDIAAPLIAEGEIIIGTYMINENMFKLSNAVPRKLPVSVHMEDIFANALAFDSLTSRGITTYYNKSDVIQVNGDYYISRFNVDIVTWSDVAQYSIGDLVYYNSKVWKSLRDTNTVTPVEGVNWIEIVAYNSDGVYSAGDIVSYSGKYYKVKASSPTINNIIPTNQHSWDRLIQSKNPTTDTQNSVWVKYNNTHKYNRDIFSSNIHNISSATKDQSLVSGEIRSFFFDEESGIQFFDYENLKFRRELSLYIKSRIISIN